jgi:hypothetical protein
MDPILSLQSPSLRSSGITDSPIPTQAYMGVNP